MDTCAQIVREPKKGADVVFLAKRSDLALIQKAGDLLSVRGYTARLVAIDDEAAFDYLEEGPKLNYILWNKPYFHVRDGGTTAQQLANEAIEAIKG